MYAMVCTRPDIAHAVSVVSRFMSNPGRQHWEAVKWIMRYLRGSSSQKLCFGGGAPRLVLLWGPYPFCSLKGVQIGESPTVVRPVINIDPTSSLHISLINWCGTTYYFGMYLTFYPPKGRSG